MTEYPIMLINMQNFQQIDPPPDSTESTESREMTAYLQTEVDEYTKEIENLLIDDPHVSVPGILQQLKLGGSCSSERRIAHLSGGASTFRKTCHPLGALRWAFVMRQFDGLPFPIDLQKSEWADQCRYSIKPDSNGDWASWWAPDMFSVEPFEPIEQSVEEGEGLYRFPAREDEDVYFRKEPSECESSRSDIVMTGGV